MGLYIRARLFTENFASPPLFFLLPWLRSVISFAVRAFISSSFSLSRFNNIPRFHRSSINFPYPRVLCFHLPRTKRTIFFFFSSSPTNDMLLSHSRFLSLVREIRENLRALFYEKEKWNVKSNLNLVVLKNQDFDWKYLW